jgi:signal transduction histidine kinase
MVVRDAVELYRTSTPAGAGRHIALREPESGLTVDVDAFRIGQVLNNLLSNALKYSPGAAEVLVSVERDGDDAVVSVIDHGIGIAPADLPHVFEPFRRTGASRELAPGVGLGLSVSRRIIEAHHGRIDVVSSVGSGSTFSVRLPLVVGVPAEQSAALH